MASDAELMDGEDESRRRCDAQQTKKPRARKARAQNTRRDICKHEQAAIKFGTEPLWGRRQGAQNVRYYRTQKKKPKSSTSDVPEKEERIGAYEYVAHKRYTRPIVIINTRSVAFPPIFFAEGKRRKKACLKRRKRAN